MKIYNEKTGVTFETATRVSGGQFLALVKRVDYIQGTDLVYSVLLVHGSEHPTRSKARTVAARACKAWADNHAFIN